MAPFWCQRIAWETVLIVFAVFMFVGGQVLWLDRPWSSR